MVARGVATLVAMDVGAGEGDSGMRMQVEKAKTIALRTWQRKQRKRLALQLTRQMQTCHLARLP